MAVPRATYADSMDRLAVITGAARRVGRATAVALAARGFNLALTRHTRGGALEETAALAKAAAAKAGHSIRVDQSELDLENVAAIDAYARSFTNPVDVLVLNASRYKACAVGSITAQELLADYQVNAAGPLLLVQALRDRLAKSALPGGGSVVAFGDIHVDGRPVPNFTSYLMSKGALHHMVQALAVALAPTIRVNGIAPGVVAWPDDVDAKTRANYEVRIPLARPGTPEDAAAAVCALTLELPYVTGTMLRLDGGRWLR